jgi:hypothetical protein
MLRFRVRGRLTSHALFVMAAVATVFPAKAQAPGTTYPSPTDVQDYAGKVSKQIDLAKEVLSGLPADLLSQESKAAAGIAGEEIKQELNARAAADKIMWNAQNAFLPNIKSEASAQAAGQLSAKDRDFIKRLSSANKGLCVNRWLLCNGIPKPYEALECSVGVPDSTLPAGRRNVGVLIIQCIPSGRELIGNVVGVKTVSLANYRADELGNCVTTDGLYWTYHGQPFAGFCGPCPDAILPNPHCPTGFAPKH